MTDSTIALIERLKRHMDDVCKEAATKLTILLQRVEKAEAALQPFAEMANRYDQLEYPYVDDDWATCQVGHLRAARNAMGEPK